ncbi:MAG TPA: thioredoxin domain-containing protein, partial [Streptosporangiaceae bacterium]|nr:thioredoxin domain-containing protein [Streptosporangiaceae bacterium]
PAEGQPSPGSRAPAGSRQPADVRPRVEGRTVVEIRPQVRARAPADGQQADEQAGDPEPDDHPADDELLPWERNRQPAPRGVNLDAALWQPAPAEPEAPPVASGSSGPAYRAASAPKPSGTPASGKSARPAAPSRSASARPRPPASSYSRRSAAARERLRQEREQESRRRRLRFATIGTLTLVSGIVIASIAFQHDGGGNASGGDHPAAKASTLAPGFGYGGPYAPVTLNADNSVTMAQSGVTQPVLDVYEDFQCSACRAFEKASGATIQQLAVEGKVKVVYYPFTVVGSQAQVASSIRAWAAAKCAPADAWASYHNLLYASQPASTTDGGFTVSLLLRLGKTAGITSPGFTQCVESQQYAVQDAPLSDQIVNSGVDSMLTLKLNGQAIEPSLSATQLRKVILSAASKKTTT